MSTITLTIKQWTSNNNICCSQLLRPSAKTNGHVDARWFGHGLRKYHNMPTTEILQTGWFNMATCSFTASRSWTLVLLRNPEVSMSETSTLHKNTIRWPQHCYSKFPSLWEHTFYFSTKRHCLSYQGTPSTHARVEFSHHGHCESDQFDTGRD